MTESTCYLCGGEGKKHGIHGLDEIELCDDCRNKFVYLRYLADPLQGSVMGFKCSSCLFECDVPGAIDYDAENGVFIVKVDKQHNFCQNCGHPSKVVSSAKNVS
jgi:hypothetical protein